MKIVFLTEDNFQDSIGGIEQHVLYLSRELAKKNAIYTFYLYKLGKKTHIKKNLSVFEGIKIIFV